MKLSNLPNFFRKPSPLTPAEPALVEPKVVESEVNFDLIKNPYIRIEKSGRFRLDDIPLITQTHILVGDTPNTAWDHFRGKHLILPDWFEFDLEPMSDAYFDQQLRLWKVLADVDRDYVADVDETEAPIAEVDAVRYPGFYIWRADGAVTSASDHVLATGMLMKHGGLKPGMWALEYGAGFAQAALAFARMGVNVDTVDISTKFCSYVKEQADFFRVNLTPFNARFGDNPRGDQKYDLIWFYESFHHCVDFKNVIGKLKQHLTPTGKILLAGEPIVKREYLAVPYPWGLRLESEVVAVIRKFHWFELGYSEDFITNLFVNHGYEAEWIDCPVSIYGLIYSFTPRKSRIELGKHWLPTIGAEGWHGPEPEGRWTREVSSLALDQSETFNTLEITATNFLPIVRLVNLDYGDVKIVAQFEPGECKSIRIDAKLKAPKITFASETTVPSFNGVPSHDTRALGIYIHSISYV
jgi:2-polyprenyl-3-methyl-5-hydroxy-6-metoxy-1,4-benzoquinol methylase